jgi:glucokinase
MPGWDGFDVPEWVRRRLDVPVHVENDVNIMALGERALFFPDVDDVIFVKVATGIGAGVISGGRLQRGAQGTAGDIGHVRVERGAGIACPCGNMGCLEAIASGPAIATALRGLGLEASSGADVLELVRQGNTLAIQAVRQAGRDLRRAPSGRRPGSCVHPLHTPGD